MNHRNLIALPLVCSTCLVIAAFVASQALAVPRLEQTEMVHLLAGGSCKNEDLDRDFCKNPNSPICNGTGPTYLRITYTNAVKRWCTSFPGVCDCNQSGVAQSACKKEATCTGKDANGDCTGCGSDTVATTVQSTVNLNGDTCSNDNDCT